MFFHCSSIAACKIRKIADFRKPRDSRDYAVDATNETLRRRGVHGVKIFENLAKIAATAIAACRA
jgi:hypothetical protein